MSNKGTQARFLGQKISGGGTNRTILCDSTSIEPTLYDTQPTYEVREYTYGTTNYYRRYYYNYSYATDIFYAEPALTTIVATRALSI